MSSANPYTTPTATHLAAQATAAERGAFISRTYAHLAGAIAAFVGLEALLLQLPNVESIVRTLSGTWWLVLLAFMGVSYVADRWAQSDTSAGMQYLGLTLYVVVEAIILLPIIYIAGAYYPGALPLAAVMTLVTFAALTAVVFIWRQDFSFLRPILAVGGIVALGLIFASMIFGFNLGLIFSCVMVLFATAAVLYKTSSILRHYRTHQHVAASLALFASVALLFFYILRIIMSLQRR